MPPKNGTTWIWPAVVAGGVALIQGFWFVAWGTVVSESARLQREIDKLTAYAEATYTKRENTNEYRRKVEVEFKQTQASIDRSVMAIQRLRDESISKETYHGRHEAFLDDLKRQNVRIDELRKDFGSSYTLSDKLKELQDQIKVLQIRALNTKETQNGNK